MLPFELLWYPETRVKLQDAANGKCRDPLMPVTESPLVQLHAHHDQSKHEAAAPKELLTPQAYHGNITSHVFSAYLHEREHEHTHAIDEHGGHWAQDINGSANQNQHRSAPETKIFQCR